MIRSLNAFKYDEDDDATQVIYDGTSVRLIRWRPNPTEDKLQRRESVVSLDRLLNPDAPYRDSIPVDTGYHKGDFIEDCRADDTDELAEQLTFLATYYTAEHTGTIVDRTDSVTPVGDPDVTIGNPSETQTDTTRTNTSGGLTR